MTAISTRLDRLRLHGFRNYRDETVAFTPGLNLITGANAQGKSNLLEATALLAIGRSPRGAPLTDVIGWHRSECLVDAFITTPTGPHRLSVELRRDSATARVARRASADGNPVSPRALLGLCPIVAFWPDDLSLVTGPPEHRRRLADVLTSQLNPSFADHLARYRRSLDHRNALLRQLRDTGSRPPADLATFTEELCHHGGHVRRGRFTTVTTLAERAADALHLLTAGHERLTLTYTTTDGSPGTADAHSLSAHLAAALSRTSTEEAARGFTLHGPHRDDIVFHLDHRSAHSFSSQGQQRTIAIACKLAEITAIQTTAGVSPILLVDDVLGELDHARRHAFLTATLADSTGQMLITSTHTHLPPHTPVEPSLVIHVEGGHLSPPPQAACTP